MKLYFDKSIHHSQNGSLDANNIRYRVLCFGSESAGQQKLSHRTIDSFNKKIAEPEELHHPYHMINADYSLNWHHDTCAKIESDDVAWIGINLKTILIVRKVIIFGPKDGKS